MYFRRVILTASLTIAALCTSAQENRTEQEVIASPAIVRQSIDSMSMSRNEMRKRRGISNLKTHIVPAGQWVFGGTLSYSTHSNDSYKLLVVENINSDGYTFKSSPLIGYSILPNSIIGVKFAYSRTFMEIDNANVNLGEGDGALNFGVDYYYALKHSYDIVAIWRQYIPLGRHNKRFALFSEFQLAMGGSQSKYAEGAPIKGTYSRGFNMSLGVNPGIVAFLTNNMAVEVNVGVLGINYSSNRQVHNQVSSGETSTSLMNFSINLFSIGLGVAFYL